MRGLSLILTALLWIALPPAALSKDIDDCVQTEDAAKRVQGCTRLAERGSQKDRVKASSALFFASVHAQDKDPDNAIVLLNLSIRLSPGAFSFSQRGNVYLRIGDYDRALADFNEAIRRDPKYTGYYYARGTAYQETGDYARAIADFDQAIRLLPKHALAHERRSAIYSNQGDYERARADAGEAIRSNPKSGIAHLAEGRAYKKKGDAASAAAAFDRAIAIGDEAIRSKPNDAEGWYVRGSAYHEKGEYDRALADLDQGIRIEADARGYTARALVYEEKGDLRRAMADYDDALRLKPKLWEAIDRRGRALARLSTKTPAQEAAATTAATPQTRPSDRQQSPSIVMGRRVALVIGNGNYKAVGRLPNPSRDAAAIAAELRRLGFEVIDRYDLDERSMRRALGEFEDRATGSEWAVVYYAGHGMEMDGRNWLIPIDAELARSTDVPDEAIDLDRVLDRVRPAKRLRVVMLDACRNNPFVSRMVMTGARTRSVQRGLAGIEPEHGEVVFYASRHGTTADDGEAEHSPFAKALLKYLGEEGLEIGQFFRRVTSDVLASTNPKQEPFVYGRIPAEDFYFRPPR